MRLDALVALSELLLRSDPGESLRLLDEAADIAPDDGWVQYRRGLALVDLKRYGEAEPIFNQALADARSAGDRQREANMLDELGIIARNLGEFDRAADLHSAALDILLAQDSPIDICICYLALCRAEQGRESHVAAAAAARSAYDRATFSRLYGLAAEAARATVESLDRAERKPEAARFGRQVVAAASEWPAEDREIARSLGHIRAYLAVGRASTAMNLHELRAAASDALAASECFAAAEDEQQVRHWAKFAADLDAHIARIADAVREADVQE